MRPRGSFGFGIVRTIDAAAARARLSEACDALSRALGVVVFPQQFPNYRELGDALDRGTIGFGWLPPLVAIELEDRKRAAPVVLPVRRGTTSYHAAIIARRGAARSLDELRGMRAAWVDRDSATYLVPRMHLVGAGFDLRTFFSSETFVHSHEAVLEAVLSSRADVGAAFCTVDPHTQRVLQAAWTAGDGTASKPVDVIALTGPIPNDGVFAATTVPDDLRREVQRVLESPDAKLRTALGTVLRADGFRAATAAHYEPLRRTIQLAREREPVSSRR